MSEFLRIAMEACPTFTEEVALQVEQQLCQMYGGTDRNYIPKTSKATHLRKQQAAEEARRTGRVSEAADRHGISRWTVYRLLKK